MFYGCCRTCNERWELGTRSTCKCPDRQPKREWLNLSYDEQEEIVLNAHSIRDAINRTQWKLEEKNNG